MSCKSVEREEAGATPRASKVLAMAAGADDVNIPLASLPEFAQEKLASLDTNGDGFISVAEIMRHGAELEHSKLAVRSYRRLVVVLVVAWLASIAAVFGVVTAGVTVTRQMLVDSDTAVMTTRDGITAVRTAAATVTQEASSELPDSLWQQLTHVSLISPTDSWVKLGVLSTSRIYGSAYTSGSIVKVLTSSGEVTFDGTSMSFSNDMQPMLLDMGFPAAGSGRHLLKPRKSANITTC